jgi:hypothetical protein
LYVILRVCLLQKLAGSCQPVNKIVTEKISDFMEEGVSKMSEMKRHIKAFSRNELELTDEDNRQKISRIGWKASRNKPLLNLLNL